MSNWPRRAATETATRRRALIGTVAVAGALTWWGAVDVWSPPGPPVTRSLVVPVKSSDVEQGGGRRNDEPGWVSASRVAAVTAAREGLAAYTRKDVPQQTWWAALAPTLAPAARITHAGEDRTLIPPTRILAGGRIVAAPTTDLALTKIPTDGGSYWVLVSRARPSARWLIERISPPRYAGS